MPQGFYRIEQGGFLSGIEAEKHSDDDGNRKGESHSFGSDERGPVLKRGNDIGSAYPDADADTSSGGA